MTQQLWRRNADPRPQKGVVAVEFALVSALFLLTLLVGIIELGRAFYYMNATAEATRWGARTAVVCDVAPGSTFIRAGMRSFVDVLTDASISIEYAPSVAACTAGKCSSVTVRVSGATFETVIPFVPLTWTLPAFATTLPTESLDSAGGNNPVCH